MVFCRFIIPLSTEHVNVDNYVAGSRQQCYGKGMDSEQEQLNQPTGGDLGGPGPPKAANDGQMPTMSPKPDDAHTLTPGSHSAPPNPSSR